MNSVFRSFASGFPRAKSSLAKLSVILAGLFLGSTGITVRPIPRVAHLSKSGESMMSDYWYKYFSYRKSFTSPALQSEHLKDHV